MSILKVIVKPNPILRKKSSVIPVSEVATDDFQRLIVDMAETMVKEDGAGLAAPQVGKNIRLIAIAIKDGVLVMINPKIVKKSLLKEWGEEGCLSVPNIYGQVKRCKKIDCQFIDVNGQEKLIEAEGFLARVVQHEIDHLNGILFVDKAKKLEEKYV